MANERALIQEDSSPYIQSTNGEVFHRFHGIGHFAPGAKDATSSHDNIWLPKETQELFDTIVGGLAPCSVFIEGSAGSGKSALIYGLRAMMRRDSISYFYIDGHYEKSPVNVIVETIKKAINERSIIFYDSADYLIGKSRKIRGLPMKEHVLRSITILKTLQEAIDQGACVVFTSHNETWVKEHSQEEIFPEWVKLKEKVRVHNVKGQFSNPDELSIFYQKSGLSKPEANYLANLINNPNFISRLLNKKGDKKYVDWLRNIFFSYSMAKILMADIFDENQRILTLIKQDLGGKIRLNRVLIWDEFIDFIFRKDYRLLFHSKLI